MKNIIPIIFEFFSLYSFCISLTQLEKRAAERSTMQISCTEIDFVIIINYAKYYTSSRMRDVTVQVTGFCQKKPSCQFRVDNSIAVDPHKGVAKTLLVRYVCVGKYWKLHFHFLKYFWWFHFFLLTVSGVKYISKVATAAMHLSCSLDFLMIYHAEFGSPIGNCYETNVKDFFIQKCNMKKSCTVDYLLDNPGANPCGSDSEHQIVYYTCIEGKL